MLYDTSVAVSMARSTMPGCSVGSVSMFTWRCSLIEFLKLMALVRYGTVGWLAMRPSPLAIAVRFIFLSFRALKGWIANDIKIPDMRAATNGGCTVTEPVDIQNDGVVTSRRRFLRKGAIVGGVVLAGSFAGGEALGAAANADNLPPNVPDWMKTPGDAMGSQPYG